MGRDGHTEITKMKGENLSLQYLTSVFVKGMNALST